MPKYAFTERQFQFLTELNEKFRQGMGSQMTISYGDDTINAVFVWGGNENILPPEFYEDDLPDFEREGLMTVLSRESWGSPKQVNFSKGLVKAAVESGFEIHPSRQQGVDARTMNIGNNYGFAGMDSSFGDVVQNITVESEFPEDIKVKLRVLFAQLSHDVEAIEDAYQRETLQEFARDVQNAVNQDNPNPTRLKITADGLVKAAETVKAVAPKIVVTAIEIAKVIAAFLGFVS